MTKIYNTLEIPKMDFWFEVYKTNEDESTETVFSTDNIKEAITEAVGDLKIDLWVIDENVNQIPNPIMPINKNTYLAFIDEILLNSDKVTTDCRELIVEKLFHQFQ